MSRPDDLGPTVLMVPGLTNSGPAHWQTLWEQAHPAYRRVEQRDWDRPIRVEWVAALDEAIQRIDGPVCLVAHSLGCATVAHWARDARRFQVAAALLVAPADVDREELLPGVEGFAPMPLDALPFPSLLVASTDDPHTSIERARVFADAWGSDLRVVHQGGHLDSAAGLGVWPEGAAMLEELLDRSIRIRPCASADLPAFEWDATEMDFRNYFAEGLKRQAAGKLLVLVAEEAGAVVGKIWIDITRPLEGPVYLSALSVRPSHRGLGAGMQLLSAAEAAAQKRGYPAAELTVSKADERTLQMYLRRGYVMAGESRATYDGLSPSGARVHFDEPVWVLQLDLSRTTRPASSSSGTSSSR